jgi:hypothetical protein
MRATLCGEDGVAESGAGAVLPFANDRYLEGLNSRRAFAWRRIRWRSGEGLLKGETIGVDGRRWRPTRRCARLCGGTRAKATKKDAPRCDLSVFRPQ